MYHFAGVAVHQGVCQLCQVVGNPTRIEAVRDWGGVVFILNAHVGSAKRFSGWAIRNLYISPFGAYSSMRYTLVSSKKYPYIRKMLGCLRYMKKFFRARYPASDWHGPVEHGNLPEVRLDLYLAPELVLQVVFLQLCFEEDLEGNHELALLLTGQVDITELAPSQGTSDFKIVQSPPRQHSKLQSEQSNSSAN